MAFVLPIAPKTCTATRLGQDSEPFLPGVVARLKIPYKYASMVVITPEVWNVHNHAGPLAGSTSDNASVHFTIAHVLATFRGSDLYFYPSMTPPKFRGRT